MTTRLFSGRSQLGLVPGNEMNLVGAVTWPTVAYIGQIKAEKVSAFGCCTSPLDTF